jgi:HSP20 family protein
MPGAWSRKEVCTVNMARWDPLADLGVLRRAMDRMVEEFFAGPRTPEEHAMLVWEPPADVYETADDVVVRVELPHVDPARVDIAIAGDLLTIRGETRPEEEDRERIYHQRELRYGAFTRTLPLPAEVKTDEARAKYRDGFLEVRIPKSERLRPRSVRVQIAESQG